MTIKNVKYTTPTPGLSSDSPTIIEGSVEQGNDSIVLMSDMTVRDLLEQILIELKKMNLRQESVFGEPVNNGDI